MTTKPPTEPGIYHWRAKEGDEWEIVRVYEWEDSDDPLHVIFLDTGYSFLDTSLKGQWQRIPTPDECQEAWGIYQNGMLCHSNESMPVAIQILERLTGKLWIDLQTYDDYTCKPAYVYPLEVEEVR